MKIKLLFFFIILFLNGYSQEIMTIEQVFNFDIGDKYQYRSSLQDQPENALTKEIIDKYYSPNGDTLFYLIHRTYYQQDVEYYPEPHWVYNFGEDTITEQYTNLDSPILDYFPDLRYDSLVLHYDNDFNYDTIIEYSELLCDRLSNGFDCSFPASAVEPNYINYRFGEGLGIIRETVYEGGGAWSGPTIAKSLTFYSKGDETCGTMDSLTSIPIIETKTSIDIFPNPTRDYIQIQKDNLCPAIIELYNLTGALISKDMINGRLNQLDVSYLKNGFYILKISCNNTILTRKIIKE
jgi:hypothetical protein